MNRIYRIIRNPLTRKCVVATSLRGMRARCIGAIAGAIAISLATPAMADSWYTNDDYVVSGSLTVSNGSQFSSTTRDSAISATAGAAGAKSAISVVVTPIATSTASWG
ncbi:MAG: hypothetical protein ACREP4_03145 [Stenotrophomonas sp.]|uniref:hypothetical protein n=1 Tax=Stenotrophomonas sp. TaxID=69392 RepID=UPI003D6D2790